MRWKQSQVTLRECGDTAQVCRDGIWKGKALLVLNLVRDIKVNMKDFCMQTGTKTKTRKHRQLHQGHEKAKVLNAFFSSIFTGNICHIIGP